MLKPENVDKTLVRYLLKQRSSVVHFEFSELAMTISAKFALNSLEDMAGWLLVGPKFYFSVENFHTMVTRQYTYNFKIETKAIVIE